MYVIVVKTLGQLSSAWNIRWCWQVCIGFLFCFYKKFLWYSLQQSRAVQMLGKAAVYADVTWVVFCSAWACAYHVIDIGGNVGPVKIATECVVHASWSWMSGDRLVMGHHEYAQTKRWWDYNSYGPVNGKLSNERFIEVDTTRTLRCLLGWLLSDRRRCSFASR